MSQRDAAPQPVWTPVVHPAAAASRSGSPDDASGPGAAVKAVARAVAYGLRSTQQRPQTVAEMTTKLQRRYDDDDVVAAAIAQLTAAGALDDATFARIWVEDRGQQRGYGVARLRQELRRRLVPDDIAEAALAGLDERDELATATALAQRKARAYPASLEPDAVARRLQGFLMRRGYGQGLANKVAVGVSGLDRYRSWD